MRCSIRCGCYRSTLIRNKRPIPEHIEKLYRKDFKQSLLDMRLEVVTLTDMDIKI
jgi:hypothetical protein